jgi:PKD repeat protein
LVAAYSFNEGAGNAVADASAHSHTGTLVGTAWVTQGKFGRALSFDGTALVSVNHTALLGLSNAMTLEAWVNPSQSGGGWKDIVFKATDIYYLMGSSSQSGVPATGGTFSSSPLFSNGPLPVNTWTHLASTYDGATLRLFVNGVQVSSRAQTGLIRASTGALSIGGDAALDQNWVGLIDEVRVYNRALSASQIQNDMVSPLDTSVNQSPIVQAGATPTFGPPPLNVTFSSAGSFDPEGTSLTYSWSFGDGSSSTQPNPTHAYLSTGTFLARLTVSDGTDSTTSPAVTISVANSLTSLVAAYGFEEGSGDVVSDASGRGNWGNINDATWISSGKFGKALEFDGISAFVTINDSPSLDLSSNLTLEAWVYPTDQSEGWQDIIFKEPDLYYLEGSSGDTGTPTTGGTYASGPLFAPAPLPVNAWSHLAATYDGATLVLYVNGAPVASRPETGPIETSSSPLTIGGDALYGQYWKGRIDEVRLYNRALTPSEILADMNAPVGSSTNQKPVALAGAAPTSGMVPLLVTFSSAGSVDPEGTTLSYAWEFGEGTISPAANPSHTYHTPGVFVARLTVSDGINSAVSSNLTITVTNPPINSFPVLSDIANVTIQEDKTAGPLPFTVGDAETAAAALTVSGTSSAPDVVPNERIVFGGSGSNRTVTITPATNRNGTVSISVAVSDGILSTSTSFDLVINPVNDPPAIAEIPNQTTSEGVSVGPIPVLLSDVETDGTLLTLSGAASDSGLIPTDNILFGGSGYTRTVTVKPAPGQHGTATILLTISDGDLETGRSFEVAVREVEVQMNIQRRLEDGALILLVTGAPHTSYRLEASGDLTTWEPLTTLTDSTGVSVYTDLEAASRGQRFYRVSKGLP